MIARVLVFVSVLIVSSPVAAHASGHHTARAGVLLPQTSPRPSTASGTSQPTASTSPAAEGQGGIATGAGIVIAAILIGGLLLMRSKLLRR